MIGAGYVRGTNDVLKKDPDLRVRQAIDLVFCKFRELGSIRQVYNWFFDNSVELPIATYKDGNRLEWKIPSVNSLANILKNPIYAGAYAYGKTKRIVEIKDGRKHIRKGIALPQNQWKVLIKDHHEAYISWDEYHKNQAIAQCNKSATKQRKNMPLNV